MQPEVVEDITTLLAVMKKANGRVVFSGNDLVRLRRVLRLHERLLRPNVCGCCRRLLAVRDEEGLCDECECGAHQDVCVNKGKVSSSCRDCEQNFWKPEDDPQFLCAKCVAIKRAEGDVT
jgi:hypothetical protein